MHQLIHPDNDVQHDAACAQPKYQARRVEPVLGIPLDYFPVHDAVYYVFARYAPLQHPRRRMREPADGASRAFISDVVDVETVHTITLFQHESQSAKRQLYKLDAGQARIVMQVCIC